MKIRRPFNFRSKLVLFFSLSVLIILLASAYMVMTQQSLTHDASELFKSNMLLTDAYRGMSGLQKTMESYLSTNHSDDLLAFYDAHDVLRRQAQSLEHYAPSSRQALGLRNTAHMIQNYLLEAEAAVVNKRGRNIEAYTEDYAIATDHHQTILRYIEQIMSISLIESTDRYHQIDAQIKASTAINLGLTTIVIILMIFLITGFSKEVTSPLARLVTYATRISHGEYDLKLKVETNQDEIGQLYESFQQMVTSINENIESLKDKVRLEKILAEERLHGLKMETALREAELSALQAQVNPHFMFNTLNIGAKIALLQNDRVTCEYLENTASIFRYNLKGLDLPASLEEEIENAQAYLSLLKTRFGDLIDYSIAIDVPKDLLAYRIPRMTLQPLVENAYIHGISDLEQGGTISIRLEKQDEHLKLIVEDTGAGFDANLMNQINQSQIGLAANETEIHRGHTTSIGLNNLIQRLKLHLNSERVIEISSGFGVTTVALILPVPPKEDAHA